MPTHRDDPVKGRRRSPCEIVRRTGAPWAVSANYCYCSGSPRPTPLCPGSRCAITRPRIKRRGESSRATADTQGASWTVPTLSRTQDRRATSSNETTRESARTGVTSTVPRSATQRSCERPEVAVLYSARNVVGLSSASRRADARASTAKRPPRTAVCGPISVRRRRDWSAGSVSGAVATSSRRASSSRTSYRPLPSNRTVSNDVVSFRRAPLARPAATVSSTLPAAVARSPGARGSQAAMRTAVPRTALASAPRRRARASAWRDDAGRQAVRWHVRV